MLQKDLSAYYNSYLSKPFKLALTQHDMCTSQPAVNHEDYNSQVPCLLVWNYLIPAVTLCFWNVQTWLQFCHRNDTSVITVYNQLSSLIGFVLRLLAVFPWFYLYLNWEWGIKAMSFLYKTLNCIDGSTHIKHILSYGYHVQLAQNYSDK